MPDASPSDPPDASPGDAPDFSAAAKAGARRAGIHMVKAGYEVLAGVSAFLEELRKAAGDEVDADESDRPQRIPLDDEGE